MGQRALDGVLDTRRNHFPKSKVPIETSLPFDFYTKDLKVTVSSGI